MINVIGNIFGGLGIPSIGFTNQYSLLLDGVDEYVDIGRINEIESVQKFSVSMWIYTSASGQVAIFGKAPSANNQFYVYKLLSDKLAFSVGGTELAVAVNGTATTTNPLTLNSWIHLSIIFDGAGAAFNDRMKIYLDAVLQTVTTSGTAPDTSSSNTSVCQYAKITGSSAARWNGNMDEIALFDYALTAGQVSSIYNSGSPTDLMNTVGLTAPIHYYRNGDTEGDDETVINDIGSAGGNNGTPVNVESGDFVLDTP